MRGKNVRIASFASLFCDSIVLSGLRIPRLVGGANESYDVGVFTGLIGDVTSTSPVVSHFLEFSPSYVSFRIPAVGRSIRCRHACDVLFPAYTVLARSR